MRPHYIIKTHSIFLWLSFFALLTGCSENEYDTVNAFCKSNPELCQEFEKDSWCDIEHLALLKGKLAYREDPEGPGMAQQLKGYKDYAECELLYAGSMQVKVAAKSNLRTKNAMIALQRHEEIMEDVVSSNQPDLLYYLWSESGDKKYMERLLLLEDDPVMQTPERKLLLISHYVKRDQKKARKLLISALLLSDPEKGVNADIFRGLSTLSTQAKKPDKAYLWLKVSLALSPIEQGNTQQSLDLYAARHTLDQAALDPLAERRVEAIRDGRYLRKAKVEEAPRRMNLR
jgi:hypothetical protein